MVSFPSACRPSVSRHGLHFNHRCWQGTGGFMFPVSCVTSIHLESRWHKHDTLIINNYYILWQYCTKLWGSAMFSFLFFSPALRIRLAGLFSHPLGRLLDLFLVVLQSFQLRAVEVLVFGAWDEWISRACGKIFFVWKHSLKPSFLIFSYKNWSKTRLDSQNSPRWWWWWLNKIGDRWDTRTVKYDLWWYIMTFHDMLWYDDTKCIMTCDDMIMMMYMIRRSPAVQRL